MKQGRMFSRKEETTLVSLLITAPGRYIADIFNVFATNCALTFLAVGVPGRIHVSATTKSLLPSEKWESTGLVEVKGKVRRF
eukprot:1149386-Pelagomonas_calceolata.AAC.1